MKHIVSVIFNLIIASVAMAANPVANVKASDKASVFNIYYKASEKGNVTVTIYDSKNTVVFTEVLYAVSSFVRPYNFESVKEGEYTIVIQDKNSKKVEKINYIANRVSNFVNIAEVPNQENKFWLFVANNGVDTMALRILGADGVVLHEESFTVAGNFSMVYNLTQVRTTGVTFELTDGRGIVYENRF